MKIFELNRYNIPEKILGEWIKEIGEDLLPVQERAIQLYGILEGRSLLISSPDTLGKTYLGEIAAVKYALERKKVVCLLSAKSILEERYSEFRDRYEPYGIRLVVSSGIIQKHDQAINAGNFDIAVVEHEQMSQLLAMNPLILNGVDLVIIDDVQSIGNPDFGPGLEITLTKIITSTDHPQIIGFVPVLCRAERFAEWLEVGFMCHNRRAVDAKEDGARTAFHYDISYAQKTQIEDTSNLISDEAADTLISNVAFLVGCGEQVVFFLAGKRDTMKFARILMDKVDLSGAPGAINELALLEESPLNRCLRYCLQKSIAFYHSDLSRGERSAIEKYADKGEIRVIFCTPSPPLGVNLPVATFLVQTHKKEKSSHNRLTMKSIMWMEYENVCGTIKRSECGRELEPRLILEEDNHERCDEAGSSIPTSSLIGKGLENQLVSIIGNGCDRAALEKFLSRTFMGMNESRGTIRKHLDEALRVVIEAGAIEPSGQHGFKATTLGSVCALKGISYKTASELSIFLRNAKIEVFTDNEILKAVASTYDGRKVSVETARREQKKMQCERLLAEIFPCSIFEDRGHNVVSYLNDSFRGVRDVQKTRDIRPLECWIQGLDAPALERGHKSYAESIATVAQEMSRIVEAASLIAQGMRLQKDLQDRLSILSERLLYGVEEKGLELARLQVRGLDRAGIQKLAGEGFGAIEAIRRAPMKRLAAMIPEEVAIRLKKAIETLGKASPEIQRAIVSSQSDDTFICSDRIEITGKQINKHNLIIINGTPTGITDRSLQLLLHLAVVLKKDGRGWVHREDLTSGMEATQLVSRLRNELRNLTMKRDGKIIENDGTGCYRISIPPQNAAIDLESLKQHWNAVIRDLVKSVNGENAM